MDALRLDQIVAASAGRGIAVVGDLMLDRYIWGHASRISQEAPVPVVAVDRTTATLGGAANVVRNLANLGCAALAFGAIGDDEAGDELSRLLEEACGDVSGLVRDEVLRTTEKTRVLAGNQQVVRIDRDNTAVCPDAVTDELLATLREACRSGKVEAIVLEDYAKGFVTKGLLEGVEALKAEYGVPVTMDPHPANSECARGLTLLTPNRAEAFMMAGAYYVEGSEDAGEDEALQVVTDTLFERWAPEHLLVTLGARGMALFRPGEAVHHIPTKAQEVFDVSGAGDTVIAAYTFALLGGATPQEAADIANHAAGVVVGKVGTQPVLLAELRQSFQDGW